MKIIREGKEIELTKEELLNAFLEQEHLYDLENIRNNMDGHLSIRDCERFRDDLNFIESAANILREKENQGFGYDEALSAAFREAKQLYFEQQKGSISGEDLYAFLNEMLKDAAAIEYKGIIFDDWDAGGDGIWANICQCCAEKYGDLISAELDDCAIGICSVAGCDVSGHETENEHHYYIDFDPKYIKPLSKEQLQEKLNNQTQNRKPSLDEKVSQAATCAGETVSSGNRHLEHSWF